MSRVKRIAPHKRVNKSGRITRVKAKVQKCGRPRKRK